MKTNIDDESWMKVYPVFGFLYGRCAVASHKRQLTLFEHDVELAFIMMVVAELNFHHHYSPDNMMEFVKKGISLDELADVKQVPVSALSLSQIINIPRESARRKLKKLVQMELLIQSEEGYSLTQKTIEYYFFETRKIYEDFANMANTVEALQKNLNIK